MRRLLFVVVVVLAGLVVAPLAAVAKGASAASIQGPGTGDGGGKIDVGGGPGSGEPGSGTDLERLAINTGIYAVAFGEHNPRLVQERPGGDLGPRHTITWTAPQPDGAHATVVQDLYPYADDGAVVYTAEGQLFFDGMDTRRGWFLGGADLTSVLTDLGLADEAPAATRAMTPTIVASIGLAALLALVLGGWRVATARRRPTDAFAGS